MQVRATSFATQSWMILMFSMWTVIVDVHTSPIVIHFNLVISLRQQIFLSTKTNYVEYYSIDFKNDDFQYSINHTSMFLCFSSKPSNQPKTLISVQILQSNQLTPQRYPSMSLGALTNVWEARDNQSISIKLKIFYSFQAFSILNKSISINDNSSLTCSTNLHLSIYWNGKSINQTLHKMSHDNVSLKLALGFCKN